MVHSPPRMPYALSIIVAFLALVTSAGGVFIDDLYRDNSLVVEAMLGNDLVTLIVVVPLLVVVMISTRRGSQRALLGWLGLLGYMLYNYIFYVYAVAFNRFFLLYVALFTLSIYALIFGLSRLDTESIGQNFHPRTPARLISAWMLFFALLRPIGDRAGQGQRLRTGLDRHVGVRGPVRCWVGSVHVALALSGSGLRRGPGALAGQFAPISGCRARHCDRGGWKP